MKGLISLSLFEGRNIISFESRYVSVTYPRFSSKIHFFTMKTQF